MLYRRLLAGLLVVAMAGFGFGVYRFLGTLKNHATSARASEPTKTRTRITLPGTIFVAQGGAIYRLRGGTFAQIATGGWTMPAAAPGNQLVVVKRAAEESDLYAMDYGGQVLSQLTQDANRQVPLNHWTFYPHLAPDGGTLYYSWDPKDQTGNTFRVDLVVYSMPFPHGNQRQAVAWTHPNHYTGGDIQPVPVPSGGMLYTKYGIDDRSQNISQLWWTPKPGAIGQPLTAAADACSAPAVTRDGTRLAMICTSGTQVARLVVAPLTGHTLGPPTVVASGLLASPAWAPDGTGLVYYQAVGGPGTFQLFYLNLPPPPAPTPAPSGRPVPSVAPQAAPAPPVPKQITSDNDFDATSAPLWV